MNKKLALLIFGFLIIFVSILITNKVFASEKVNIYFFWGQGCPHCAKEKLFLERIKQKYPEVKIYDFEVWFNEKNRDLLIEVGKKLNADISGVPLTIIGDQYIIGYYNDDVTGNDIEAKLKYCFENKCPDPIGEILNLPKAEKLEEQQLTHQIINKKEVKLYFFLVKWLPIVQC